ncbi:MAG: ribokinase [Spirochaetes bacterium]|nr:ribokinase [Spirochaetota bacterium]
MILNFGSLNADLVFSVPHFVRPGETLASDGVALHAGGKGANQSIALARAGAKTAHAGKIGPDGAWMKSRLDQEGVDTRHVLVDDRVLSGQAIIQVNPQGENCILLSAGANGAITRGEIDGILSNYGRHDLLVLQNEISETAHLIEAARARGMVVVFNAAPCTPAVKSYPLSLLSLLVVNETEGADLTGETGVQAILDAAAKLWPETALLLTLGGEGAWFAHRQSRIHQGVFPAKVVDTTAAGDTFLGFFLAAWSGGASPQEALKRAALAASITVSRPGAADSIPTAREVDDVLRTLLPG